MDPGDEQRLRIEPPAGDPINARYNSVVEYETGADRAAIIEAVRASFTHLKAALARVPDETLDDPKDLFGTPGTVRGYLLLVTTHMHEHLGQLVAYARMNGVTPPWSQ